MRKISKEKREWRGRGKNIIMKRLGVRGGSGMGKVIMPYL